MEYIEGIKLNDREELVRRGHDLNNIAERLVDSLLNQIFIQGFFHADPHPGNLMVLKDGRLAFIDFGMVGSLSDEMKQQARFTYYWVNAQRYGQYDPGD